MVEWLCFLYNQRFEWSSGAIGKTEGMETAIDSIGKLPVFDLDFTRPFCCYGFLVRTKNHTKHEGNQ